MKDEKEKLDEAADDVRQAISSMDSNTAILESRAAQIKRNLEDAVSSPKNLEPSAIESIITPGESVSEKIIKLAAKYRALDECMSSVKKGFEKGVIDLEKFLSTIRDLASKQHKQLSKMQRLQKYMCPEP